MSQNVRNAIADQLCQAAEVVRRIPLDEQAEPENGREPHDEPADWTSPDSGVFLARIPRDACPIDGFRIPTTFAMSRKLANQQAVTLNANALAELGGQFISSWHVVVRCDSGFRVCRVQCRGFKPSSPCDLPPNTTRPDASKRVAKRAVRLMNQQFFETPKIQFQALHVKRLLPLEGGAP